MNISLAVHIISLVMWIGGVLILTRAMHLFAKEGGDLKILQLISNKVYFGWILPGLLLSVGTGVYQLISRGVAFYMKQGWFHAKLTLVLVLIAATVALFFAVKDIRAGIMPKPSRVMGIHGIAGLVLITVVFLTLTNLVR
jgi:putative membrane protein